MSDFNLDENTINKLKNMMDKGDLSNVISQIPPEMMQNFSSMMQNNSNSSNSNSNNSDSSNSDSSNSESTNSKGDNSNTSKSESSNSGGFDFSSIDMNTIMKMKSVMENMNNKNDPRSNLLYSLKPYLREEKKDKLDQYANLMNVAKMAGLFKTDGKENKK